MNYLGPIKTVLFQKMQEAGYLPALLSSNDATPEMEQFERLWGMLEPNISKFAYDFRSEILSQERGQDDAEDNTDAEDHGFLGFLSFTPFPAFLSGVIFCRLMVFLLKLFK